MLTIKPLAEITNDPDATSSALPAVPLLQQLRRIQVDKNAQRALVQTLKRLSPADICAHGHVLPLAPKWQEKTENYAEPLSASPFGTDPVNMDGLGIVPNSA